jgi:alpha-glucosidase
VKKHVLSPLLAGLLTLVSIAESACRAEVPFVRVSSPNGQVRLELVLQRHQGAEAVPHWRLYFKDQLLVLPSRLAVDLAGGAALGGPCAIESVETRSHLEDYAVFPGKRRHVRDHCTDAVAILRERTPPRRRWELVFRVYDDGAAFRYRFPAQDGWPRLIVASERTEFALPEDASAYALPLNSFTTSHEKLYQKKRITEIPKDWILGLPLLVECPGRGWAAITEANLTDYAGMYLAPSSEHSATLTSRLSPLPKEPQLAVKAALPHASPWRVVLLADNPLRMIESDLILHLNEPCALAETSWVQTGKTTFPWWNDYHLEKVSSRPGLNTATMKHYIDFCAEAGIPYHSLDGYKDTAWYGGPIVPYKGAGILEGLPGLDLSEVIRYAKSKGVRLRLWMHWQAAQAHMDQAFPRYRDWGIEGVMIDFMDRDDQEMVNWQRQLFRKAAENHLTVTLHGVAKPTGLERTYPHVLNHEGVLNLEYDKWDKVGCPPEHQVTVAFTRMLAGPLDFHQGSFRCVSVEAFKPRYTAPLVMGTPSRTLASYVVYQNHLPMVADYPSAYRGHPGLAMLAKIPTSWDDTKALSGLVGEYIVLARRNGTDWYIGAMNGRQSRAVEVPLRFLGPGRYRAEIYADEVQPENAQRLIRRTEEVTASDVLKIQLAAAGGYLARLSPLPKKAAEAGK